MESRKQGIDRSQPTLLDVLTAVALPKMSVRKWTGTKKPKNIPEKLAVYELKESFSVEEARIIARKLAANSTFKQYGTHVMGTTVGQKGQIGAMFIFDRNTGIFNYAATDGIPLPDSNTPIHEKIYLFLQQIGLYDPTIEVVATYKKKSTPNTTYLEIKRSWKQTQLPIFNPIGLLNLDEQTTFSQLSLTANKKGLETNTDIYGTSDKSDGLQRKNDFNSMTITMTDVDSRIIGIRSNIRFFYSNTAESFPVISYEEALAKLQNSEDSFILTTPSGGGSAVAWDKLFPDKEARAEEASVTDSALAYLEQPPGGQQSQLEPFYIFRGFATLETGYRINYLAAVSAVDDSEKNTFSLIPAVHAYSDPTQKQAVYHITPPPTPTPTVTPQFSRCVPQVNDLNPYIGVCGTNTPPNALCAANVAFGWAPIAVIKGEVKASRKGWWYYVPAPQTSEANLSGDISLVIQQIQSIIGIRVIQRDPWQGIIDDFRATGGACPIRITGDSPTIFIYAQPGTSLTVKPEFPLTYYDPKVNGQEAWEVTITDDRKLEANGAIRPYLYYEYSNRTFTKPAAGWVISKEKLNSVIELISSQLILTSNEKKRLQFELEHAASYATTNDIFIGLIDQKELETKLPLKIWPLPEHIDRFHFYVGDINENTTVHSPLLLPITRSSYHIVEIGSYAAQ